MNRQQIREVGRRRRLFYHHGHRIDYPLVQQSFAATPEEEVRLDAYLYLTVKLNYPPACIDFEYPVKMGSSYKRIDIAVFADERRQHPFMWVECKRPGTGASLMQEAIKQVFSYDNQLPAPYLWVTNGMQHYIYRCEWRQRGRERYPISQLPRYNHAQRGLLWWHRFRRKLKHFWQTYLLSQLRREWVSKWLLITALSIAIGLGFSWLHARTLTPFVLHKTQWLKHITFQHLYWFVALSASFSLLVILFGFIIPRRLARGVRQKPGLTILALLLISLPVLLIPNLLFGADATCFRCGGCASQWQCWWTYAHFRLYKPNEWFWQYFTPYMISAPLQAFMILLTAWGFKVFEKLN